MLSKYQSSINSIFFSSVHTDLLYKDNIKPFIKDQVRFERAMKILGTPVNKEIFEIGPYPGTGVFYFGEANKIYGYGNSDFDFSEKFKQAGHHLKECNLESGILPDDCKADIILLMEVLEHIRMPYQLIKNLSSSVKSGGQLYLTTNNQFYIGYLFKLILRKNIFDPISTEDTFYPGHCRYYDLKELKKVFADLGWIIVQSNYVNFLPNYKLYKNEFFGFWKNLFIKLFPKGYSTHIEFLLVKKDDEK